MFTGSGFKINVPVSAVNTISRITTDTTGEQNFKLLVCLRLLTIDFSLKSIFIVSLWKSIGKLFLTTLKMFGNPRSCVVKNENRGKFDSEKPTFSVIFCGDSRYGVCSRDEYICLETGTSKTFRNRKTFNMFNIV